MEFTRPVTGNAGEVEDAKLAALGLEMPATDGLAVRLRDDFRSEHYGYEYFASATDPVIRAVASARLRAAVSGIGRNLLEARLHEHGIHDAVGPNGVGWRGGTTTIREEIQRDHLELHLVGFLRAVGSVFDCAAAVLVGVARIPVSIVRADINNLLCLDTSRLLRRVPDAPATQLESWEAAADVVRTGAASGPEDWLTWALEMRNAYVHRGRASLRFHNRHSRLAAPIFVETSDPPQALVRYDPYLIRRPWLNDMQNLLHHPFRDQLLPEPAQNTVTACRRQLVGWCETVSRWVLETWSDRDLQMSLRVHAESWEEHATVSSFSGFSDGSPREGDLLIISPNEMELVQTAKRLVEEGHATPG